MKKTTTICLLLISLFIGGVNCEAKTTKKKAKAKTTQTGAKAQVVGNSACSYINFSSNGNFTWGGCDSGPYIVDNDAYIMVSSHGGAYVLWDDGMYTICYDTPGAEDLVDWLASNGYNCKNKMKQIFSFDDSGILKYSVDGIWGSIDLNDEDYDDIKWIKR